MTLLTDLAIKHAKARRKPYNLKDGGGLYLRIKTNGSKSWYLRFYWQNQQQRMGFGLYPEVDLKKARSLRQRARDLLNQALDPRAHRAHLFTGDGLMVPAVSSQEGSNIYPRIEREKSQNQGRNSTKQALIHLEETSQGILFADYAEHWKAFKFTKLGPVNPNGRQSTQSQIERYLAKDMIPILGNKPLQAITRADLLLVQRKIEQRGALTIAEKCRSWLNEIFRHAIAEGHIESNPASEMDLVALPQAPTLHNPFLTMDELPEFLATLNAYRGARQTQLGLQLLLLTGVRTGELRQAKPEHFDLNNGLWRIPAETVKQLRRRVQHTKRGDNRIPPYLVPLSHQAVDVVEALLQYRYRNQQFLLCHRSDSRKMISENTLNSGLKRMGYRDRLTSHGMRATLSTALNELGYPKDWIEAQLSHSDKDKIRASYNHAAYVDQRRGMMQDWADLLDQLSKGEKHEKMPYQQIPNKPINANVQEKTFSDRSIFYGATSYTIVINGDKKL